jgi:hypothetical protein
MHHERDTNVHEFRVVGLSRSGTHAVINWLLTQVRGRHCFLNCAEPRTNPFDTARPLANGRSHEVNYPGFDLAREQAGDFSRKDVLLHSYEDCFLGMVCDPETERRHDELVGRSRQAVDVLILRDPFNLFASRKKAGISREAAGKQVVTWGTAARIWAQHARAYLRGHSALTRPLVAVNYNRWAREPAYRRALAERLELDFNDTGFHRVPAVADGSSFDGTRFHGRPEKMDVLRRWRHFADDPHFRALFSDEVVRLSQRIFGVAPFKAPAAE